VDDADEERVTTDKEFAQKLGVIQVSVHRVKLKEEIKHSDPSPHGVEVGTHSLCLAEKAVKGRVISHATK
jgi:hypothetical protein